MMEKIDKRLTVPKKTKMTNLIDDMYLSGKVKFKQRLAMARKVTIGLDIWTKKGLTASFLAISACYFNTDDNKPEHILLNLKQLTHPHTAQVISGLVDESLQEWGIHKDKILTIITDNGSNMVAAFPYEHEEEASSTEDDDCGETDDEEAGSGERYEPLGRTPCVVHTLQLVVNLIQKDNSIKRLLDKIRHLVRQFRKSSVATEQLLQQCGLSLIKDCPTRWSSSYLMLSRLLEVKESLTLVANTMGWDCLLPSEWQKVVILRDLLLPFAEHTKVLESDTSCLSLVVPALMDLKSHLSEFSQTHARSYRDLASLAQKMSDNLLERFTHFLDVDAERFSPLAAAACFLDSNVAEVLIENEEESIQNLLKEGEQYIVRSVPQQEELADEEDNRNAEAEGTPAKQPRFKFFSSNHSSRPKIFKTTVKQELKKYKELLSDFNSEVSGIQFWLSQSDTIFPNMKPLALDILSMPASQAFAERVFSLTGDLSSGRRNRARVTLERSAFLKLNKA
ncbi:zinc finger BED domain-containing protein 4-like [Melanotaenia boesemani]|uniref:zinc finger BED domain-containing protein 4-like n=2 Tax=Melanotaenia boesemani TaxID=1250792 RepID=UPI001C05537B|nr:zinc finger BED domain-containing protein 4-like [Melanotaenia boesemani]